VRDAGRLDGQDLLEPQPGPAMKPSSDMVMPKRTVPTHLLLPEPDATSLAPGWAAR
jgi:hypothetical protein